MKIRELMNRNVSTIRIGSTMREAAEILSRSWASDLMVVDDEGCFVGVLSEGDLIRAAMPRFDELLGADAVGTPMLGSFQAFAEQGSLLASRKIDDLVISNPLTFGPSDDALKAASTMVSKQIRRLPVIEDGRLVGTVARCDIALAILKG
jgi:CBS domain-containing protein